MVKDPGLTADLQEGLAGGGVCWASCELFVASCLSLRNVF